MIKGKKPLTVPFNRALREGIVHVPLGHKYGEEGPYMIAGTDKQVIDVFEKHKAIDDWLFVICVGNESIEIPQKSVSAEDEARFLDYAEQVAKMLVTKEFVIEAIVDYSCND